jgi:hypothetical protein
MYVLKAYMRARSHDVLDDDLSRERVICDRFNSCIHLSYLTFYVFFLLHVLKCVTLWKKYYTQRNAHWRHRIQEHLQVW